MPNIKSAEKRLRQTKKRTLRNRAAKSRLRTSMKKARQAAETGDREAAVAVVDSALETLRSRGASLAHFWCARGAPRGADTVAEALRRGGFRAFHRGKVVVGRLVGKGPAVSLPGPGGWMFRMGDTDGI